MKLRWVGLFGIAMSAVAFALAGYGFLVATPRWSDDAISMSCGIGGIGLLPLVVWRLMPAWLRAECEEREASVAQQRYTRAMLPAMALYVLVLFGSSAVLRDTGLSDVMRALVALLPVLPVALVIRAMIRYLREIDELQRRIETEAICLAALAVSMLYFAGGFLQRADVIDLATDAAMFWVFPLMSLTYAIAKLAVSRHYR